MCHAGTLTKHNMIQTTWSPASASRASTLGTWTRCSPLFPLWPLSARPPGLQSGSFPDIPSMMSLNPWNLKIFPPYFRVLCVNIVINHDKKPTPNLSSMFATVQWSCLPINLLAPFPHCFTRKGSIRLQCPASQHSSGWPSLPVETVQT